MICSLVSRGCEHSRYNMRARGRPDMPARKNARERSDVTPEESMPTKSPAKKTSSKTESGGTSNGLQKPLQPSKELAAVIGSEHRSRGEVVSKVWDYIKAHDLQNPENRRE